jgi:hypothetical protein
MTDFALLDVALGVIFAILTFSLIASALHEALASAFNWRGRMLRRGLFRLLEGATKHGDELVSATWLTPGQMQKAELTLQFLQEPSIKSLYGPQKLTGWLWDRAMAKVMGAGPMDALGRLPSSIPRDTFARALIGTLMPDARKAFGKLEISDGIQADEVAEALAATRKMLQGWADRIDVGLNDAAKKMKDLPMDQALKDRLLRTMREVSLQRELQARLGRFEGLETRVRAEIDARIERAQAVIDDTVLAVGDWFDQTMDRVTGWYVRRAKWVLFLLGLLLAAIVNFDVIGYGNQLLNDEGLRQRIAVQAEAAAAAERVGDFAVQPGGSRQLATLEVLRLLRRLDPPVAVEQPPISPEVLSRVQAQIGQASLRRALGLDPDPAVQVSEAELKAAADIVSAQLEALLVIDLDGDGQISAAEQDAAINRFVERMETTVSQSLATLQSQFADRGVEMGWSCPGEPGWTDCFAESWLQSIASWVIIGLGCTLGGQFWFDLLRQVVKVKTAASGLNTDLKRLTGATGGRAQGSGMRQGT